MLIELIGIIIHRTLGRGDRLPTDSECFSHPAFPLRPDLPRLTVTPAGSAERFLGHSRAL